MYTFFIRISARSGNPELWGYKESNAACEIVYGSLVTGGFSTATKESGYGVKTANAKVSEGYKRVSLQMARQEIYAAKDAVRGLSKSPLSSEAYAIYALAMKLWGKIASIQQNTPVSTTPATATPVARAPVVAQTLPKQIIVTSGVENAAWAW